MDDVDIVHGDTDRLAGLGSYAALGSARGLGDPPGVRRGDRARAQCRGRSPRGRGRRHRLRPRAGVLPRDRHAGTHRRVARDHARRRRRRAQRVVDVHGHDDVPVRRAPRGRDRRHRDRAYARRATRGGRRRGHHHQPVAGRRAAARRIAQAIAEVLYEGVQFDEHGNPLTTNLADHPWSPPPSCRSSSCTAWRHPPRRIRSVPRESASRARSAIAAVRNAVRRPGADLDAPLTPERIWRQLTAKGEAMVCRKMIAER